MFKCKIVDGRNDGTRRKRRRGELYVQEINRAAAQFSTERQGDAHDWSMWPRSRDRKIWPAATKTLDCLVPGNIESVLIDRVDPGQRFDEIDGVGFVTGQLRVN